MGWLLSAGHLHPSRVKAPLRPMRPSCPETVCLHQFFLGAILSCPPSPVAFVNVWRQAGLSQPGREVLQASIG